MISVVYFGTHHFSAHILETLIQSGVFDIKLVITQPDRPVGRKKEIQASPVKIIAQKYNIKIEQPETLKNYHLSETADLNITCQYGLIIPKTILETAKRGSINVHTSLLPKYRGASPIQSVLIHGEKETGITVMLMDEKMDHGDILRQQKITIGHDDTYTELNNKMLAVAPKLLIATASDYIEGKITPQVQIHEEATFCKEFTREDGKIDWNKTGEQIYNLYRGLTPWPGIWTEYNGKRLKLLEVKPANEKIEQGKISAQSDRLFAGGGENTAIEITKIQLEGKNPMNAKEFINGFKNIL
ncbi:MAG: methionyl-tRNA formyltransferase [Candidatus Magasanikbacteria bacterium]